MHSCKLCSAASLLETPEMPLSALEQITQREDSCPVWGFIYQGVMTYKERWGHLSEEFHIFVQISLRITKDTVLEVDIRKVFEVQPIRVALIEFYVLPGTIAYSHVPQRYLIIILLENIKSCLMTNRR